MTEYRRYTHLGNCKNHYIYQLRNTNLGDDYLTIKLADLVNAYRPHTPIPTRNQLENDNTRIDKKSPCGLKSINKSFKETY